MDKGKARKERSLPLPKSELVEKVEKVPGFGGNEYGFKPEHHHLVMVMAANGMSIKSMANAMQINRDTLKRHFKAELTHGADAIKANMGAVIVNAGLSGNITAAKFWLVCHADEWKQGAGTLNDQPESGLGAKEQAVQFYLPRNGRDQPEEDDPPPIIDGVVEKAA
jgi:hypothetical protein